MREVVKQMRRIGLVVAGVGSVMLGLLVAWAFVKPGVIGGVGTGALVAIFGLLVLPAVVYWVWTVDRRAAVRHAARMRSLAASGRGVLSGPFEPVPAMADAGATRVIGWDTALPHVVQHDGSRGDERRERPHRAAPRTVHAG